MLSISNVYGHGFAAAQVERIRSLGFTFREQVSTFAGAQTLYFVDFQNGPALEFIDVEDEAAYLDFLPTGMAPYCPGISLTIPPDSPNEINTYQANYQDWGANPRHVNYDGSDTLNQPGWNYLNFDNPVVQGTFIYLSQPDEPPPARRSPVEHLNTVTHVSGLVFDLEEVKLARLAELAGLEQIAGQMNLGGTPVSANKSLPKKVALPEKQFPLALVTLKACSLDFFLDRKDIDIISYQSNQAVYIKTTAPSWNLIVTD